MLSFYVMCELLNCDDISFFFVLMHEKDFFNVAKTSNGRAANE